MIEQCQTRRRPARLRGGTAAVSTRGLSPSARLTASEIQLLPSIRFGVVYWLAQPLSLGPSEVLGRNLFFLHRRPAHGCSPVVFFSQQSSPTGDTSARNRGRSADLLHFSSRVRRDRDCFERSTPVPHARPASVHLCMAPSITTTPGSCLAPATLSPLVPAAVPTRPLAHSLAPFP